MSAHASRRSSADGLRHSRVIRRARLAVLLASTAVAAGCGGGAEELSKEEFIAQADAICAVQQEQLDAVTALQDPERESERIAISEKTLEELRALPPPQGDEEAVDEVFSGFERSTGLAADYVAALRAGDVEAADAAIAESSLTLAEAVSAAVQYGFTTCTRFAQ